MIISKNMNNHKTFFSIIIPLYNKNLYIIKAIHSILAQTYQYFELIIINDGSTDNSLEIVKNIDFSSFDVTTINQPNQGVSITRNNGVKIAKHEFIAFLDADDWWDNHFLEEMALLIEKYPDAGIYGSSYYKVKNNKNIRAHIGVNNNFTDGYINYFKVYAQTLWMPLWTGAVIIQKKEFEEEKGFKPQLRLGEDFDLWVRIALKHEVAYLNKPLAYYNQDVNSEDRAVVSERLYPNKEHFIFNLDYLTNEEKGNDSLKKLLDALRVYVLFPYYLDKKRRKDALNELEKVNWNIQPFKTKIRYKMPVIIVKNFHTLKLLTYRIKQKLFK